MKKHLKWLIPLILFLCIPFLMLWYVLSMPSLIILARLYIAAPEMRSLPESQRITLDTSTPKGGVRLRMHGYSLTLEGYETAEDITRRWDGETPEMDYATVYKLGEDKFLMLGNPNHANMDVSMRNTVYSNEAAARYIDAYAGRHLDTEFDWYQVSYGTSMKDISWTNNEKNLGLAIILISRAVASPSNETIYEFDRGDIQGFLHTGGSSDTPIAWASIFRKSDLNKKYGITFLNFSLEEVLPILSSLTFEE